METAQRLNDHAVATFTSSPASCQEILGGIDELKVAIRSIQSGLQGASSMLSPQTPFRFRLQPRSTTLSSFSGELIVRYYFLFQVPPSPSVAAAANGQHTNVHEAPEAAPVHDGPAMFVPANAGIYAYAVCLFNLGLTMHLSCAGNVCVASDKILHRCASYYESAYEAMTSHNPKFNDELMNQTLMVLLAICTNLVAAYGQLDDLVMLEKWRSKLRSILSYSYCRMDQPVFRSSDAYLQVMKVSYVVAIAPLPSAAAMA